MSAVQRRHAHPTGVVEHQAQQAYGDQGENGRSHWPPAVMKKTLGRYWAGIGGVKKVSSKNLLRFKHLQTQKRRDLRITTSSVSL